MWIARPVLLVAPDASDPRIFRPLSALSPSVESLWTTSRISHDLSTDRSTNGESIQGRLVPRPMRPPSSTHSNPQKHRPSTPDTPSARLRNQLSTPSTRPMTMTIPTHHLLFCHRPCASRRSTVVVHSGHLSNDPSRSHAGAPEVMQESPTIPVAGNACGMVAEDQITSGMATSIRKEAHREDPHRARRPR